MKLDPTVLRTMNRQDFRVLAAIEMGMRDHELVPAKLIVSLANLRHGGTGKILSSLLRDKLLSHDRSCGYDGYRLTNSGYDILALHNLKTRGFVAAIGDKIGTGKESDVYVAANKEGHQVVLKFHRLGRTSFRDVKKKRDYFMVNAVSKSKKRGVQFKQQPNSWLFLSRVSALKEFSFMKALYQVDYPTPAPVAHNRHVVVMSLVRGIPLYQMHTNRVSAPQAESIFQQSTALATRLAQHGLVHCDLNEFNLLVDMSGIQNRSRTDRDNNKAAADTDPYVRHSGMSVASKGALSALGPLEKHYRNDGTGEIVTEKAPEPTEFLSNGEPKPVVTLIDFPQMVSTKHPNAQELYERDMDCLKRFFVTKLKCLPEDGWHDVVPRWEDVIKATDEEHIVAAAIEEGTVTGDASTCLASKAQLRLDAELKASGYSDQDAERDVQLYYYENDPSRQLKKAIDEEDEDDDDEEEEDAENEADDDENDGEGERDSKEGSDDNDQQVQQDALDRAAAKAREAKPDTNNNDNTTTDGGDGTGGQQHGLVEFDTSGMEQPRILDLSNEDDMSFFTEQTRVYAQATARRRVKQESQNRQKKKDRKNAFRSRNNNKTFEKGKRVFNDIYL